MQNCSHRILLTQTFDKRSENITAPSSELQFTGVPNFVKMVLLKWMDGLVKHRRTDYFSLANI